MLAAGTAMFLAMTLWPAAPAAADPKPRLSEVRLCDPTGCYIAWRVVDSDHDGVSDADELMAGSDPYDPKSRPLLQPIVDLAFDRKLPSFEAGLGTFLVVPQEILEARNEAGMDILGAFGMDTRRDAIKHLGMTFGEVDTGGVDLDPGNGFTFGLNGKGGVGSMPGAKVGGIDAALLSQDGYISVGGDTKQYTFGQEHGGVKSSTVIEGGTGTHIVFNDGTSRTSRSDGAGGATVTTTGREGDPGPTTVIQTDNHSDGDTAVNREKSTTTEPNGDLSNSTISEQHVYADGAVSEMTVSTTLVRDEKGEVTGTIVTTTVTYSNSDGSYGSAATTVESCDTSGSCTEVASTYEDTDTEDDEEYVDPDADTAIVTFEMVDGVLRTRGAAVNVVAGWTAPGFENDPTNPNDPGLVMLVDSDLSGQHLLISTPRVTKAQPEGRDDLPNPGQAAPTGGGPCRLLCG